MRAILLSAGPSLARLTEADIETGDVRIGVNRAAKLFPCDWWCAGDWEAVVKIGTVLGSPPPQLCTIEDSLSYLQDHHPQILASVTIPVSGGGWRELIREHGTPNGTDTWSATMGLLLAHSLGATEILCYGVDMAGSTDCGGEMCLGRGEGRWQREKPDWDETVKWMESHGTKVVLVRPVQDRRHVDGDRPDRLDPLHTEELIMSEADPIPPQSLPQATPTTTLAPAGTRITKTLRMIKPRRFGGKIVPAGTPIAEITVIADGVQHYNVAEALRNAAADFV